MIVVDASVAVKWFVNETDFEAALSLLEIDQSIVAPDLVVAEVLHALRRKLRAGDVTEVQYLAAAKEIPALISEIVPSASVASEAAKLSITLDHGFYDCVYLALAVTSGSQLVTADEVFASKAARSGFGSALLPLTRAAAHGYGRPALQPATVATVARLAARVSQTLDGLRDAHSSGERFQFHSTSIYRPAFESPAYLRLKQLILELTPEELAQIIALAWFGRDYERGPFEPLVEHARRMFADSPDRDVRYIISVMGTVRAGFEKLRRLSDGQR